jgi:hypothetical protein
LAAVREEVGRALYIHSYSRLFPMYSSGRGLYPLASQLISDSQMCRKQSRGECDGHVFACNSHRATACHRCNGCQELPDSISGPPAWAQVPTLVSVQPAAVTPEQLKVAPSAPGGVAFIRRAVAGQAQSAIGLPPLRRIGPGPNDSIYQQLPRAPFTALVHGVVACSYG